MNAGSDMITSKVSVFLKQGLADQKKWIFERQFSIGRDSTADICIKDPTVSRFHAFVHLIGGTWWIRDMNSSNGTFINGKQVSKYPVEEQIKLQLGIDGPILHLNSDNPNSSDSETVIVDLSDFKENDIQYFNTNDRVKKNIKDSGSAIASKDFSGFIKSSLKKWYQNSNIWRKISPIAASVIVVGLILAGYLSFREDRDTAKNQKEITIVENLSNSEGVSPSKDDHADAQKNLKGINTVQVTQSVGSNPPENPIDHEKNQSTSLQQHMIRNYTADIYFNAAKKFSAHNRWQAALEYYQKVSEINPDYPQLNNEIAKLKFEIDNQAAYQQAIAYFKEKRYEQGIALLSNFPENSVYFQKVGSLISDAEKKRLQAAEEQKKIEARKLKASQKQKAIDTINESLRYYAVGKTKSSIKILNRVMQRSNPVTPDLKKRANTLKKEIGYAKSLYYKGDQAYESGQIDQALSTWTKLLKVDLKLLGNKKGYFSRSVRQKMADEYGTKAMKAYSDGDFPAAYQHSKKALHQKGNHPKALEVKKMLQATSKRLYEAGYILEAYNPVKAMEKWKLITKICDADSKYYQRALAKINWK